ncbi:hypothetical protein Tco_0129887, partial [Tanacetum coccineum]
NRLDATYSLEDDDSEHYILMRACSKALHFVLVNHEVSWKLEFSHIYKDIFSDTDRFSDIAEDVFVNVGKFQFPADFVVVDFALALDTNL